MKKIYLYLFLATGLLAECSLSASDASLSQSVEYDLYFSFFSQFRTTSSLSQEEIRLVEADRMLNYEFVGPLLQSTNTELDMYQYALFYYMKNSKFPQVALLVDNFLHNCDIDDEIGGVVFNDFLTSILEGMHQRKGAVTEEDRAIIRKFEIVPLYPQDLLRGLFHHHKRVSAEPFIDFLFEKVKINVNEECFKLILYPSFYYEGRRLYSNQYCPIGYWTTKDMIKKCITNGIVPPKRVQDVGAKCDSEYCNQCDRYCIYMSFMEEDKKLFDEAVLELTLQKRPFLPSSHPKIRLHEIRKKELAFQRFKKEREKELLRQEKFRQEQIEKDNFFSSKIFQIPPVSEHAEREAKRLKLSGKDPMWNTQ